jgi:phage tail sheath protein FI
LTPDVYVREVPGGTKPIRAVGTSGCAFLGLVPKAEAPRLAPTLITSWGAFVDKFVGPSDGATRPKSTPLVHAVRGFFENGGGRVFIVGLGEASDLQAGLDRLKSEDDVQIVVAPGFTDYASYDAIESHCMNMGDRVAILDGPEKVDDLQRLTKIGSGVAAPAGEPAAGGGRARAAKPAEGVGPPRQKDGYAAIYYPWIYVKDVLNPKAEPVSVPPSGHIAGIYARSDATRGVHKAPANEAVMGALGVTHRLDREQQKLLNPEGVNAIRQFADEGILVWGARTVAPRGSEFVYVNVRRLTNMIKESIRRSTRWIVFEPNDERLWGLIKRDLEAFLLTVWRDGALRGTTPEQAFFVKCDADTNPKEKIDLGELTALIGISPVKPAEFVVFEISQEVPGGAAVAAPAANP